MKKKIKKIIIFLVVMAILGGSATGGVFAYQNYRQENLTAEVTYVSNLNWGYYDEEGTTSEGTITNESAQSVYTEDKSIKEVLVSQGDSVDVDTPLLVYDTTQEELQVEMKQLDIQGIDNDITLAKRELEHLKTITPVPDEAPEAPDTGDNSFSEPEEGKDTRKSEPLVLDFAVQKKSGDAYNYIDKSAKPYEGEGTPEEPYRFLCTQECYVTGSYLNILIQNEQTAAFEIWSGNSREEGNLISCWTVDGTDMSAVQEDSRWSVVTQQIIEEVTFEEEEIEEEEPEEPEDSEEPEDTEYEATYTVSELKEAIEEKETQLKELDIRKRGEEISLEKLKKDVEKGTVKSTMKGIVKTVGDKENPPMDGSPFMEIMGAEGLYVKGEVGELMLDQIEVGQVISVNSWNSGQVYTATITEISDYPSESNGGYYGEGNGNISFYQFTAYIENPEGLTNGDFVNISMTPAAAEEPANILVIEKAYVREENGRYYVLKAGDDERLVKQYVQTGRTLYGSGIEIKGGLSENDRIAFPYGKTAKEGIRAVESSEM